MTTRSMATMRRAATGPNLGDSLIDLGVLTDRSLVRRLSRTPVTR